MCIGIMKFIHKLRDITKLTFATIICLGFFLIFQVRNDYNIEDRKFTIIGKDLFFNPMFVSPNESVVLENLKKRFLKNPSHLPYNLRKLKTNLKRGHSNFYTTLEFIDPTETIFPNKIIQMLYPPNNGMKHGYFVEAGALDGEYLSNTLYLEMKLGWTGLLVEPSLFSYKKLVKKNRRAWTCNCCLGTESSVHEALLASYITTSQKSYFNQVPTEVEDAKNFLVDSSKLKNINFEASNMIQYEKVQCLPLRNILQALNVSKIDLFSLDTEGTEQDILDSFPWGEVIVDVWIVEHKDLEFTSGRSNKRKIDQSFISWFKSKGYESYFSSSEVEDYFFVRNNSTIQKRFKSISKETKHKLLV